MSDYWILNGHEPVLAPDVQTWGKFFEHDDLRRVGLTEFDGGRVSTVFLGINHRFGPGAPLLFETMIFGGSHDEYCDRYETWEQAVAGHQKAVELASTVKA